jgi:hypothetical protein
MRKGKRSERECVGVIDSVKLLHKVLGGEVSSAEQAVRRDKQETMESWARELGTLIGWGWRVDGRKCVGEGKRDDRKMRQACTWEGTEAVHPSEAVARSTPNRNTISAH